MREEENIILVFNQLSKESQLYLMNMANMARIAESSKQKELEKNKTQSKMNTEICELVVMK